MPLRMSEREIAESIRSSIEAFAKDPESIYIDLSSLAKSLDVSILKARSIARRIWKTDSEEKDPAFGLFEERIIWAILEISDILSFVLEEDED